VVVALESWWSDTTVTPAFLAGATEQQLLDLWVFCAPLTAVKNTVRVESVSVVGYRPRLDAIVVRIQGQAERVDAYSTTQVLC
jgi:hypothetical protein